MTDVLDAYRKALAKAEKKGVSPVAWWLGGEKLNSVRHLLQDDISPPEHLPEHLRMFADRRNKTLLGLKVETLMQDGAALQCLIFVE